MSSWSLPPGTQEGGGFQLFSSDTDVSDALVDLQRGSINCYTSMNGYLFAPENSMVSATLVPGSPVVGQGDQEINRARNFTMAKSVTILLLALVLHYGVSMAMGLYRRRGEY
ncbi:hypothetical protein SLEP1_g59264 [Rubroshorea leprosula]|uniref:Uncharacterized protein n=1 Tax=Rubroshorea leprosula TaxID=152421 RepID=A0AAV5MRT0_9ROSI|nr:hypothetical protein SLEP1_g59264 [Rubroshorea leprosula]